MKCHSFILLILGISAATGSRAQKPSDEHVPGRLLVQKADAVSEATAAQVIARVGAKVHHKIDQIGVSVLDVPEAALDAVL